MSPTKRATVNYSRIAREEAAHDLAGNLRSAGFDAKAEFTNVQGFQGETVTLEYPPLRGMAIKTWAEAREIANAERQKPRCKVVKLSNTATLPTRGSPMSAGLDLSYDGRECTRLSFQTGSSDDTQTGPAVLHPGHRYMLTTGLAVQAPAGCYGRVAPRSGLAVKGLDVSAGVVDADYTGELRVIVSLHPASSLLPIAVGDRIAQLIFEQCVIAEPVEVETLEASERGSGGFGSTGC